MRTVTAISVVLLLLVSWNGPARADLLVASFDSFQVLRYDTVRRRCTRAEQT
jgi:hypothetical protein